MLMISSKQKKTKKNLILTFDDGLKCHYKFVLPVLKKFKVNGIFMFLL